MAQKQESPLCARGQAARRARREAGGGQATTQESAPRMEEGQHFIKWKMLYHFHSVMGVLISANKML